jgi:hypothetical protein
MGMTVNLGERQVGFDALKLGFPSIDGCMAIVVVLPDGLYGYHSFGGELAVHWPKIVPRFKEFIEAKGGNLKKATRLYAVAHLSKRGWRAGPKKDLWKEELRAYKTGLGLDCRTSGYNADDAVEAGFHDKKSSIYVEFEKFGAKCDVSVQSWPVPYTKKKANQNPWNTDIKTIQAGKLDPVAGDIFMTPSRRMICARSVRAGCGCEGSRGGERVR